MSQLSEMLNVEMPPKFGGIARPGVVAATAMVAMALPEVTVRLAELLVTLPKELETVTWNVEPLFALVVAGVV
jgi:hypothetical protein